MRQTAPHPTVLHSLVSHLEYRPGWAFSLEDIDRGQGSEGLTFIIVTRGYNSYHVDRGESYCVHHYMPVPPAAYDERSWRRWLFEQLLLVERHECMEFFAFRNGGNAIRPYAPSHGPGNDPYIVRELGDDVDQRTSFRGEVSE